MKPTHSIGKSERFKNLTSEQGRAAISSATSLKVVAPAGSGKTTLQMAYAAARPQARGLYLAFGKPTQLEADRKLRELGVNTVSKTSHSLAYPTFGAVLNNAGKLQNPTMRAAITAEKLGVNYAVASAVNAMLNNFMCSADPAITEAHLPDEKDFPMAVRFAGHIMDGAQRLWTQMIDPMDPETQATHDVYLKQWAITNPKLDANFILFDEAQDANPLLAHLVNQQTHCTRVYVGDPHQAIFGFRGASNLMDELQAEQTMALTASFRFTPNIGLLASTFLKHWKNNQYVIHGKGAGGPIKKSDQQAFLSRTVAGLIEKGFELHTKGLKLHWVKGFKNYRVNPIMEAYGLFKGDRSKITDPVLKLMPSWSALKEYVEATHDGEAGPVYRLIEKYRDEIPNIIKSLEDNQIHDSKLAPIVLTTAHMSKGLEWPVVRLINDFFTFKDDEGKFKDPSRVDPQEANLMYVALTRGMKAVAPTEEISEWFRAHPETQHLFPKPSSPEPAPSVKVDDPQPMPHAA